jgi:DNA ligase-1
MLLYSLATTWADVAATASRRIKIGRLAATLAELVGGDADETAAAAAFLSGEIRQRQIGVGWAALRDLPPGPGPADVPTLTVAEVDAGFERIGRMRGAGSQAARRAALADLLDRATEVERRFLTALLIGELRQGALVGVMVEAIAAAAGTPVAAVRRALLLGGDLPAVAVSALRDGVASLAAYRLVVGRPLAPMLAGSAADTGVALGRFDAPVAIEEKLDGARVQVHRDGSAVAVFTRSLDDITGRVPEIVELARALPVRRAVLDGEVIALGSGGRPQPFQVTASRVGSRQDVSAARTSTPLTPVLFDALHVEGTDLLDAPGADRFAALAALVPPDALVRRIVTADPAVAREFFDATVRRGHEGVVVKSTTGAYAAGRRGGDWLKVKPRHTLDLVVLAAEWGHGRRRGWLSNLHLGARRADGTGFVMLGKTFKGLTDAMLGWQTERLLALEIDRDDRTVRVRPELVVEIAFDGVQRSSRYPGGVALRFARVLRHRPDKAAVAADTLDAVLAIQPPNPSRSWE